MRLFNRTSGNSSVQNLREKSDSSRNRAQSFATKRNHHPDASLDYRSLIMETLEERQLLSVTTTQYEEIQAAYPGLSLPADMQDVNIIEITSVNQDTLESAISKAAQTTADDLIILTDADQSGLTLTKPIVVNLDSTTFGDLTIVGSGEGVQLETETAAFDIQSGEVTLAGFSVADSATPLLKVENTATVLLPSTSASSLLRGSENFSAQATNLEVGSDDLFSTQGTTSTINTHENDLTNGNPDAVTTPLTFTSENIKVQVDERSWVNSTAEMLWTTGWAQAAGFESADAVGLYISESFAGGFSTAMNPYFIPEFGGIAQGNTTVRVMDILEWFISGNTENIDYRYEHNGYSDIHLTNKDSGGFFPDLNFDAVAKIYYDSFISHDASVYAKTYQDIMAEVELALISNTAVSLELTDIFTNRDGGYVNDGFNTATGSETEFSISITGFSDMNLRTMTRAVAFTTEDGIVFYNYYNDDGDYVHDYTNGNHSNRYNMDNTKRYFAVWIQTDTTQTPYFSLADSLPYAMEWDATAQSYLFATEPIIDVNYWTEDAEGNRIVNEEWVNAYWALRDSDPVYNLYCEGKLAYIDTGIVTSHRDLWNYEQYKAAITRAATDQNTNQCYDFRVTLVDSLQNRINTSGYSSSYSNGEGEDNRGFTSFRVTGANLLASYYAQVAPYSLADTLKLQSNPGAPSVIYLDFSVMGLDGIRSTVSFQESIFVQQVWEAVAEKFTPFNVNVTTDASAYFSATSRSLLVNIGQRLTDGGGSFSSNYGPVTFLSPVNYQYFLQDTGVGGQQYYSVFTVANGNFVVAAYAPISKVAADWVSYYVGQSTGLSTNIYYYTSSTDYAAIMSYPMTLKTKYSRWSSGDFLGSSTRDSDLSILGSFLGIRTDENNGTLENATALNAVGYGEKFDETANRYGAANGIETIGLDQYDNTQGTYMATGVISSADDVDSYSFTATESKNYVIDVSGAGADHRWIDSDYTWESGEYFAWDWGITNLTLKVELLDAEGNVLYSQSRITNGVYDEKKLDTEFSHFITPELNAGQTYYIRVTSAEGQPNSLVSGFNNEGSVGSYTLSMTEYYENLVDENNTIFITTLADQFTMDDSKISIREALAYMGRRLENGTFIQSNLVFKVSMEEYEAYQGTITLNPEYGQLYLNRRIADQILVIDATSPVSTNSSIFGLTLNANNASRVIKVDNITLELSGFTLTGGQTSLTAHTISTTLEDFDTYCGGGLYNLNGWVTLTNCTISGNEAYKSGGGIFNVAGYQQFNLDLATDRSQYFGELNLINCLVSGNRTSFSTNGSDGSIGGGISNWASGTLYMLNTTVAGNTSNYSGGGLCNIGGDVVIINSILAGNNAVIGPDFYWYDDPSTGILPKNTASITYTLIGNVDYDPSASSFEIFFGKYYSGSLTTELGNIVGTVNHPISAGFAVYKTYGKDDWTNSLWKNWDFHLLAYSFAVDSANNSDWLTYWSNYWDTNYAQSQYELWINQGYSDEEAQIKAAYDKEEYLAQIMSNSDDLAQKSRIVDASIDMGAYEYSNSGDLLPYTPSTTVDAIDTNWSEAIIVSNIVGDREGLGIYSPKTELSDDALLDIGSEEDAIVYCNEDIYLNFSFMNLGRSTNQDFHILLTQTYYQSYDPIHGFLTKEKELLDFVMTNDYVPGNSSQQSSIQVFFQGQQIGEIAYKNSEILYFNGEPIGTIAYNENGVVTVEDLWLSQLFYDDSGELLHSRPLATGQYTYRVALDSTQVIDELNERNNNFSTTINVRKTPSVVNTYLDVVDPHDGLISLREAISFAGYQLSSGEIIDTTITFDAAALQAETEATGRNSIVLQEGEIIVDKSITIDASDFTITIDGNGQSRLFSFLESDSQGNAVEIALSGLILQNGAVTDASYFGNVGGAIYNEANLTVDHVVFQNNTANQGGALYNTGTMILTNVSMLKNIGNLGGSLYNTNVLTINASMFAQNTQALRAGVLYNDHGIVNVENSVFENNNAVYGGVALNYGGMMNFYNTTFQVNTATSAGVIDNYGYLKVMECAFIGNKATDAGAVLYNNSGYQIQVESSLFLSNSAVKGGVVYNSPQSTITINSETTFSLNKAQDGAVVYNAGTLTIENSTLTRNAATRSGGAIFNATDGTLKLTSNFLTLNGAATQGGTLHNEGTAFVSNSVVAANFAANGGGLSNSGTLTLYNSTISTNGCGISDYTFNYAPAVRGGGLYNTGTVSSYNTIFANNYASTAGPNVFSANQAGVSCQLDYTLIENATNSGAIATTATCVIGTATAPISPEFVSIPNIDSRGFVSITSLNKLDFHITNPNSPIIAAGNVSYALDANGDPLLTDIEGSKRFNGKFVDMGAYQYRLENASLVINTLNDVDDPTDGLISLREAIEYAKDFDEADRTLVIDYDALLKDADADFDGSNFVIKLNSELIIDTTLVIDARNAQYNLILEAEDNSRIFFIKSGEVSLLGLSLTGGNINTDQTFSEISISERINVSGAAIANCSTSPVTIQECNIYGNNAFIGSAIFSDYGTTLFVKNSKMIENTASHSTIYNCGTMTIEQSVIAGNQSSNYGGAIANYSVLNVINTNISGNSASYGGGIYNSASMNATNVTLVGNQATVVGGGLWTRGSSRVATVSLANTIASDNVSPASPDVYAAASFTCNFSLIGNNDDLGSKLSGTKNLVNIDPKFINFTTYETWTPSLWSQWNLRLNPDSDAVDSGSNELANDVGLTESSFDVAGVLRICATTSSEKIIDMGAYEDQNSNEPTDILFAQNHMQGTASEGTLIGSFTTVDAAEDTHTYALISGSGDNANGLFFIRDNGLYAKGTVGGGTYDILVRSTDQTDLFIEKSLTITITQESLPAFETPTITKAFAVGSSVMLNWSDTNGGRVKEFQVRYSSNPIDETAWIYSNTTFLGTSGKISGNFEIGQNYAFQIRALGNDSTNSSSNWSETSDSVVIESVVPTISVQSLETGDPQIVKYSFLIAANNSPISKVLIDWGDGTVSPIATTSGTTLHYYAKSGNYNVSIAIIQSTAAQNSSQFYFIGSHTIEVPSLQAENDEILLEQSDVFTVEMAAQETDVTIPSMTTEEESFAVSNVLTSQLISSETPKELPLGALWGFIENSQTPTLTLTAPSNTNAASSPFAYQQNWTQSAFNPSLDLQDAVFASEQLFSNESDLFEPEMEEVSVEDLSAASLLELEL